MSKKLLVEEYRKNKQLYKEFVDILKILLKTLLDN